MVGRSRWGAQLVRRYMDTPAPQSLQQCLLSPPPTQGTSESALVLWTLPHDAGTWQVSGPHPTSAVTPHSFPPTWLSAYPDPAASRTTQSCGSTMHISPRKSQDHPTSVMPCRAPWWTLQECCLTSRLELQGCWSSCWPSDPLSCKGLQASEPQGGPAYGLQKAGPLLDAQKHLRSGHHTQGTLPGEGDLGELEYMDSYSFRL